MKWRRMTITINNVDILPYNNQPMTVTLGQAPALMNFVSLIGGASCQSCPGQQPPVGAASGCERRANRRR